MRKIILMAALAASSAVAANAATWVATCNDGKNLQYVQTVSGPGFLYLQVGKDFYQTARLAQTSAGDTVLCGAVQANAPTPITQICIDKSRQSISLKYAGSAPDTHAAQDAGKFCSATVTLRATNLKDQ